MVNDPALIVKCGTAATVDDCVDQCKWREGKIVAANDALDVDNKNAFESNFCHPPILENWDETAPACLNEQDKQACEQVGKCVWSTGQEFKQPSDFCSIKELSFNAAAYSACWKKDEATCTDDCKWNKVDTTDTTTDPSTTPVAAGHCQMNAVLAAATAASATAGTTPVDTCADLTSVTCPTTTDCEWIEDTTTDKPADSSTDNSTDTTTPSGPRPLFTEEFCHPITINKDTTEDVFSQCVDKQSATECDNAVCKWSNGKDLIPERDFCAPKDMTKKLDEILGCIGKDSATTCDGICEWRRGV